MERINCVLHRQYWCIVMRGGQCLARLVCGVAVLTATAPAPAFAQSEPQFDFWGKVRENGKALYDELKERARPRQQPSGSRRSDPRDFEVPDEPVANSEAWLPPGVRAPTFSRITIEPRGATAIEGTRDAGEPRRVEIRRPRCRHGHSRRERALEVEAGAPSRARRASHRTGRSGGPAQRSHLGLRSAHLDS